MSKGLGKIERKIIEALKEREKEAEKKGYDKRAFLGDLACDVFDGELIDVTISKPWGVIKIGEEPTRSQYVSVWRAVKSLEGKGVVQTQIIPYAPNLGQGGGTHASKVKLNVDFIGRVINT